jgi:hypothetical protein
VKAMIYILTDIIHCQDDSEIYEIIVLYIEYLAEMDICNKQVAPHVYTILFLILQVLQVCN